MTKRVLVSGSRDVRGSIDLVNSGTDRENKDDPVAAVVACPPHPRYGGTRYDERLRSVSDYLINCGVDCIRFDYGEWTGGNGECEDAQNVIQWVDNRYERVGVFGYSFGGAIALLSAASINQRLAGVSVLAPESHLSKDLDSVTALENIDAATQVVYGSRDSAVNWEAVVDRARDLGCKIVELQSDHFFVGQQGQIVDTNGGFLVDSLNN
jgi:hypothetical protein